MTRTEKKITGRVKNGLRYIGEHDLPFYLILWVTSTCWFSIWSHIDEFESLPVLRLLFFVLGIGGVILLTAAYMTAKLSPNQHKGRE